MRQVRHFSGNGAHSASVSPNGYVVIPDTNIHYIHRYSDVPRTDYDLIKEIPIKHKKRHPRGTIHRCNLWLISYATETLGPNMCAQFNYIYHCFVCVLYIDMCVCVCVCVALFN